MFLSAVYYFIGMSKLTNEERRDFVQSFEEDLAKGEDSFIKAFFLKFLENTGDKYKSEVEAILVCKNYEAMATSFKTLFDKIIGQRDLQSLVCYCENTDPREKFFIRGIIKNPLEDKCGFSYASYLVANQLAHSGGYINFEQVKDLFKRDILGLSALDLAVIGLASVKNTKLMEEQGVIYSNHHYILHVLTKNRLNGPDYRDLLLTNKALGLNICQSREDYIGPFLTKLEGALTNVGSFLLACTSFSCAYKALRQPFIGTFIDYGTMLNSSSLVFFNCLLSLSENQGKIEDGRETNLRMLLWYAREVAYANITYDITTTAINEYVGYPSLASKLVGAVMYAPVVLLALQAADKYIYRWLNKASMDKAVHDKQDSILNGIREGYTTSVSK